ncbi:hypothetical protein LTV02_04895 [Nocardia yamanashiensis]|uniref:hypothetical protein n=1 Tax=Nocardia yamanashiensis TaxID=209247 RepID=UPI001E2CEA5E|nr:hypothetical protein [Nocardia yamanashiensis]UGT42754.1 hypothetical protein LTV02_04895 [Nocardia yamanashiensis]
MSWEICALLSIAALCVTVIARSWWDFYRDAHSTEPPVLHLPLLNGGHLEIPRLAEHAPGRHRPLRAKAHSRR